MDILFENPGALAGATGALEDDLRVTHEGYFAGDREATFQFWRQDRNWRRLPYCRAQWSGPYGETEYLADRNYSIVAVRVSWCWQRGFGETLSGFPMANDGHFVYCPGKGQSPYHNDRSLNDLLRRCASHRATSWLLREASLLREVAQ